MITILVIVGVIITALYTFMATIRGSLIVSSGLLFILSFYHIRRKDYHFIQMIDIYPQRIFTVDHLLVSLPIILLTVIHGHWIITVGILLGCIGISFIKQPFRQVKKGFPVPSIIPIELFEFRTVFRKYGIWLLILYTIAFAGVFFPYISLIFLWLYASFWAESFRICEPITLLCSDELSSKDFLHRKLWINIRLFLLSILPVCILYTVIRPDQWWIILLFFILISFNVLVFILYKYTIYEPNKKIMTGQVSLGFSYFGILFPIFAPLTLFLLIRYYISARKNLIFYLYAYH